MLIGEDSGGGEGGKKGVFREASPHAPLEGTSPWLPFTPSPFHLWGGSGGVVNPPITRVWYVVCSICPALCVLDVVENRTFFFMSRRESGVPLYSVF